MLETWLNRRSSDLDLPDQTGRLQSVICLERNGPTLVVFVRGHWCPYCRRYLCKLQAHHQRLRDLDVTLFAISPEPCETSAALVCELGLTFPVLCDREGRAITALGVRNGYLSRTVLPHPSVILFDGRGVIRFRSVDRNYKLRTSMHRIFREIGKLAADSDRQVQTASG